MMEHFIFGEMSGFSDVTRSESRVVNDAKSKMPDAPASAIVLAAELKSLLRARWDTQPWQRWVIGIAGESGSGKSVTADCLAHSCTASGVRTLVLNQDNYFYRPPRDNHEHRIADIKSVGPQEVNMTLLADHISAFRSQTTVPYAPLVNYEANQFDLQTLEFASMELLIVEGTYVLQLPSIDVRIFLEATHKETKERRRARNRDIDAPIVGQVLAIEHRIIARQAKLADVLIDAEFKIVRGA